MHQHNPNKKADSEYISGDTSLLLKGNNCRLLDGRRTPGYIEEINYESGLFRWRITDFEDKGNYWDMPFEKVTSYQFDKVSKHLSLESNNKVKDIISTFDKDLVIISKNDDLQKTEEAINKLKSQTIEWLNKHSTFLSSKEQLDFSSNLGSEKLSKDLIAYLKIHELDELESKTADIMVLNPNSGEWIKGMAILLAELGLVSYYGKVTRTKDIFTGMGSKDKRKAYIFHRLAYMRALFDIFNIKTLPLYRGMASEVDWKKTNKTFVSFTFNSDVAKSFSGFDGNNKFKNAYLIKSTVPISLLFMTYFETAQMNERYKEAEALIFNSIDVIF